MATTTLSPDHNPSVPCKDQRDEYLNMVMTTALEGGIGYWSVCSRYRWHITGDDHIGARDFIAVITEIGDEDPEADDLPEFVIDRGVISRGIRKAYARGGWNDYQAAAITALNFGRWDDCDFDAITADLVVQFGLFGEQRYN